MDYDSDSRLIKQVISDVEWGLHDKSNLEIGEPSKYLGWTFFTVSLDVPFILKMMDLYSSFRDAKGWTHYEKFETWLNDRIKEADSQANVKATVPREFGRI